MNPLLERGNTRLAPLDTVEPDLWEIDEHFYRVQQRDDCGFGEYYPNQIPYLSMHKVESLLSQCRKEARKEALLEAANEIGSLQGQEIHDTITFQRCAERLRRMAEGDK